MNDEMVDFLESKNGPRVTPEAAGKSTINMTGLRREDCLLVKSLLLYHILVMAHNMAGRNGMTVCPWRPQSVGPQIIGVSSEEFDLGIVINKASYSILMSSMDSID